MGVGVMGGAHRGHIMTVIITSTGITFLKNTISYNMYKSTGLALMLGGQYIQLIMVQRAFFIRILMKPPPFLLPPPLPDIDLRNILHISLMRQTI